MSLRNTLLTALASLGATLLILAAIWLLGPGMLRAAPAPQDAGCGKVSCVYVPPPTQEEQQEGCFSVSCTYIPIVAHSLSFEALSTIGGSAQAVEIVGDHLYYNGWSALRVVDIRHPATPQVTGVVSGDSLLLASVNEIHASGSRLYTKSESAYPPCCLSATLGLWDISQLDAPSQISTLTSDHAAHIWADSSHLYASSQFVRSGVSPLLRTYVISDTGYAAAGTAGEGSGLSLVASGGYAYVSDRVHISIFDVSDIAQPLLVGTIPVSNAMLALDTDRLYVVGDDGLTIWDVSIPSTPMKLGALAGVRPALDMVVQGEWLYIACGVPGLFLIDVSDPVAPHLLVSYNTPGYAQDISVSGNLIAVADGSGGLLILRIS